MPSLLHKAITDLIEDTPTLAVRLAFPDWEHDTPAEVGRTELAQSSLMADLVFLLGGPPPTHTLVVEIQLHVDRDKRFVWPAYVSAAHHKHRLPVTLLIVSPDREVAQAARAPLSFDGHELTLQPVVIGPDELPMPTRPEDAAKDLDLAALSALAHMHHPEGPKIAAAVLQAIRDLPEGTRVSYDQLMRAVLGPIAKGETMLKPYRLYVPETIALVAEAEQRGEARGEQRGQLEGHRAGLRFGWAARFGAAPMPAAVEEALQAADLEAIMRAGPALLGAQDAEAAAAALLAALVGPAAG